MIYINYFSLAWCVKSVWFENHDPYICKWYMIFLFLFFVVLTMIVDLFNIKTTPICAGSAGSRCSHITCGWYGWVVEYFQFETPAHERRYFIGIYVLVFELYFCSIVLWIIFFITAISCIPHLFAIYLVMVYVLL